MHAPGRSLARKVPDVVVPSGVRLTLAARVPSFVRCATYLRDDTALSGERQTFANIMPDYAHESAVCFSNDTSGGCGESLKMFFRIANIYEVDDFLT